MIKASDKNFTHLFITFLGFALFLFLVPVAASAQESDLTKEKEPQTNTSKQEEETTAINKPAAEPAKAKPVLPVYHDYKGVQIGMKNKEVRNKLSKLKEKGETQDFFIVSDREMVQVFYDGGGMVNAISVTYTGKLDDAPTPMSVLGEDLRAKEDGSMFKMVRYPDAGFWISYSRTGGKDAIVTVTMQKM